MLFPTGRSNGRWRPRESPGSACSSGAMWVRTSRRQLGSHSHDAEGVKRSVLGRDPIWSTGCSPLPAPCEREPQPPPGSALAHMVPEELRSAFPALEGRRTTSAHDIDGGHRSWTGMPLQSVERAIGGSEGHRCRPSDVRNMQMGAITFAATPVLRQAKHPNGRHRRCRPR